MNHWLITQLRIIKTGMQYFVRNLTLAIAAIAVMVITLTIILFSVIANATFNKTIQDITDKIDISIYLKDEVAKNVEQRTQVIDDLKKIENVREVNYVSKEDALEKYKADNKDKPDLLTAISATDNPLPASLQVKPVDPNRIDEIKAFIEKPEIKALQSEETSYSGDRKTAIDKISQATSFLQRAGIVGIVIFMIVSILIIFNTIRMTIFNRRDELQIMRLLGASTWFIRGPFVVETVVYGIISAMVSVVICNTLFVVSSSAFEASSLGVLDITFASQYFKDRYWIILTSQLLIGILIGAASSAIATRRYLKFKTSK
ncbi:MAG TPA: permease-like cell division protein FtsX [Candidatus Limnocylindria bacterium]|nr:permease-like cell division protein FtsX [Candidatus Limnocylindria bacterium]